MLTLMEAPTTTSESPLAYREEAEHRIANSLQMISALVRQRARSGHVQNPQTFLLEIADRIDTVENFIASSVSRPWQEQFRYARI